MNHDIGIVEVIVAKVARGISTEGMGNGGVGWIHVASLLLGWSWIVCVVDIPLHMVTFVP